MARALREMNVDRNEEKDLEGLLDETPNASQPAYEKDMEDGEEETQDSPQEEEAPEAPEEPESPEELEAPEEDVEEVAALTEREKALIAQLTESPASETDTFDPTTPPTVALTAQEYQFIKEGESIDDILSDPAKFNAKMAQLYNDALQRGAQLALEATYRSLPRTISTYAKQQIEVVSTVNDFYSQNKDLIPLKPALARIAQKIGTEHPEYSLPQLLGESAKAARALFALKKEGAQSAPKAKTSPAFVQQKGGTNRLVRPKGAKTIEDEVMDLIS